MKRTAAMIAALMIACAGLAGLAARDDVAHSARSSSTSALDKIQYWEL